MERREREELIYSELYEEWYFLLTFCISINNNSGRALRLPSLWKCTLRATIGWERERENSMERYQKLNNQRRSKILKEAANFSCCLHIRASLSHDSCTLFFVQNLWAQFITHRKRRKTAAEVPESEIASDDCIIKHHFILLFNVAQQFFCALISSIIHPHSYFN